MITYKDLEHMERGKQQEISDLANLHLDDQVAQRERQTDMEEQMLGEKSDAAMTEDALAFIAEMDKAHDDGDDPMKIFESLPTEMQQRISELLKQQSEQEQEQQFQAMPQQNETAGLQQGNANITDHALQIAQL